MPYRYRTLHIMPKPTLPYTSPNPNLISTISLLLSLPISTPLHLYSIIANRNWDELKELIEAELASKEVIDTYLSRIEIKDGRVSLEAFRHFMSMLDLVLVDESGDFVADLDQAVDMSKLTDYDDDDEDEKSGTKA